MLHWTSFGGFLSGVRTIMGAIETSDLTCASDLWLGHMAYFFIVVTMLLKSWRVHRIVNNKSLVRIKITLGDIQVRLFGIMMCALVYLLVLQVVARPHTGFATEELANQTTMWPNCRLDHSEFELTLFCIEFVILCFGANLSHATKDIPAALNESRSIAEGMYDMYNC